MAGSRRIRSPALDIRLSDRAGAGILIVLPRFSPPRLLQRLCSAIVMLTAAALGTFDPVQTTLFSATPLYLRFTGKLSSRGSSLPLLEKAHHTVGQHLIVVQQLFNDHTLINLGELVQLNRRLLTLVIRSQWPCCVATISGSKRCFAARGVSQPSTGHTPLNLALHSVNTP